MEATTRRKLASGAGKHTVLLATAAVLGFPLLWMVLSSLKSNYQALAVPPVWIPHPIEWDNYPQMLAAVPFYRYVLNTLMYAAITIVGVCISSSLVAYGFSRIKWRGRDFLFKVMVSTLLIPFFATLIPLFVMYKRFHMVGWYWPLIVPTFFGSSIFSTFLLRQFFMTIPQSVSDAARIDGANEFTIYSRVILPMAKPALATVILFQFVYCWNDYLGPLVYIDNQNWYPLTLGLGQILGTYTTNWPWVMAAATAATAPIIILFFFTQRTFISGIAIQGTGGEGLMSIFSPTTVGRPDAAAAKPRTTPGEAGTRQLQVMAVLVRVFNVMALNGLLVIACLPIITAPAALLAATVALERWREDGDDRVVRQFILALRARRFWRTTLTVGVPLVAAALAVTEVLFFSRAANAGNAVGLGLGFAGLLLALTSTGYVLVLGARQPDLPSTDVWFLAVALVARNLLVASPLLAGESVAGSLLLLRDPSLVVLGIPLGVLALVNRTASRGLEHAGDLIVLDTETLDDREVEQ